MRPGDGPVPVLTSPLRIVHLLVWRLHFMPQKRRVANPPYLISQQHSACPPPPVAPRRSVHVPNGTVLAGPSTGGVRCTPALGGIESSLTFTLVKVRLDLIRVKIVINSSRG